MTDRQKRPRSPGNWLPRLVVVVGFGGLAVLIVGVVIVLVLPMSEHGKARRALDLARLPNLLKSASSVDADGTSNMFTMSYRLRFHASADEIETFIGQSPGLKGVMPEYFTPQHMSLP